MHYLFCIYQHSLNICISWSTYATRRPCPSTQIGIKNVHAILLIDLSVKGRQRTANRRLWVTRCFIKR